MTAAETRGNVLVLEVAAANAAEVRILDITAADLITAYVVTSVENGI